MSRSSLGYRILSSILIILDVGVAGYGIYRLGYAQGYQSARFALNGAGRATIRPLPFFGGLPYNGFGPRLRGPLLFSFLVPLFWIGIVLLIIFAIRTLRHPISVQPSRRAVNVGETIGENIGQVDPKDMGPYDPYHLRDKPAQPGNDPGPTPPQA